MVRELLDGPHVWRGDRLARSDDWVETISADEAAELDEALRCARASGRPLNQVRRCDFPLDRLAARLAALTGEVENGRGFALLRGLPVERYGEDDLRLILWGLGSHIGVACSQSRNGELLGEVRDLGVRLGQPDSRGYRSAEQLRFHVDRCDCLALLCVREPKSGGLSRIVSSATIHNEIRRRRPDLLDVLYRDFYFSRQGEEVPGEGPWFARPIFAVHDGQFTAQFSQSYIESAQRFPDVPRLTEAQQEAVDLVARLAEELCYDMQLRRGDIQLLNNHVTFHSRTRYEDHDDPERKRLLYRLWLATPFSRSLPAGEAVVWGETRGGAIRGGVAPQAGPRYAFTDWASAGWMMAVGP